MKTPGPWGFWLTVAFGMCIFGTFVLVQSVVVLVFAVVNGSITDLEAIEALALNGLVLSVATLVSLPFEVALCGVFAWLRQGVSVSDYLGLRWVSWKAVLLGWVCVVALGVAYDGLSRLLGRSDVPEFMINAYRTAGFAPLLWLAIVLGAPLAEEIFFRGFLFKGFESSPLGGIGAVLLTALSWAIIHLQYDPYDIGAIFLLGILLGVFRWKTGSILPALLMHVLQNLVATIQVACLVSDQKLAPSLL